MLRKDCAAPENSSGCPMGSLKENPRRRFVPEKRRRGMGDSRNAWIAGL